LKQALDKADFRAIASFQTTYEELKLSCVSMGNIIEFFELPDYL